MPTVTGIEAHSRRSGRYDVSVDGQVAATLGAESVARLGLRVGLAADDKLVAELERESAITSTLDRALNMLAFRARSVRELRRALVRKGEPEAHVDAAIERLTVMGLLNDADFARQFARSKLTGAGYGAWRIRAELSKRGVPRPVVDRAIEEVVSDIDASEPAVADRIARKKLESMADIDPAVRRRRLYAFLARRGYSPDEIKRATATLSSSAQGGKS
ncbi:MAG: regulatory protein RecX [Gemmatimonadaceae bacterium]